MSDERSLVIDCSEMSRGLDHLFRTKYSEYLYALDMHLLSDFIIDYILCNVNTRDTLSYLGWNKLIDNDTILFNLKDYIENNLPTIKSRVFNCCLEVTKDTEIKSIINNASILLIFILDEEEWDGTCR